MDNLPISLPELKAYLRIDGEEEDNLLASLLLAVKEHCENYLKGSLPSELPNPVKQAVLLLTGHFYEQRAGEDIPKVVYDLLSPYRVQQW